MAASTNSDKGTSPFPKPKCALFVYGAGSGLGKSTLAGALVQQFESQGHEAFLFPEECALELPAFQTYVQRVQAGDSCDTTTLLECCTKFITDLTRGDADIIVLDSLLPCWDWLYSAGADDAAVFAFTDAINALLGALRPVLVLVEGDLDRALDRAIEDRGINWALDLAEHRIGRRDRESLSEYFRALRLGTNRAVSSWNYEVIRINTVDCDLESSVRLITAELAAFLPPTSPG